MYEVEVFLDHPRSGHAVNEAIESAELGEAPIASPGCWELRAIGTPELENFHLAMKDFEQR
jgi:hypothetical protein